MIFDNSFLEFVYYNVLSFESKQNLENILKDKVNKPYFLNNQYRKFLIKSNPQPIYIFISLEEGFYKIIGYQFGKSDFLTGELDRHIKTVENILLLKTQEEIEKYY